MVGLAVATSLIASLLLVHVTSQRQPMPRTRPLDVDAGLPLPELGQASTVFSLTALFGAYLGIHLLLGLPALLGLACGTVLALVTIRHWILRRRDQTFDEYLFALFGGTERSALVLAVGLSGIQCAYACSELLILQSVADRVLGLQSEHAALLAVILGVMAYFYVLFGGYAAVFRTDVLQFVLVATMGAATLAFSVIDVPPRSWASVVLPRPGYWTMTLTSWRPALFAYHFLIGGIMGLGFLLASPDAWKRVFLVSREHENDGKRFYVFAAVGTAPFLLLVPMAKMTKILPDGPLDPSAMWSGALAGSGLFVATTVALIGSFLSAFNGALVSAVHVGLVMRRRLKHVRSERARFHWLMASALLAIMFLFAALRSHGNPYFLANLLLGPYAICSGVLLGTRGGVDEMPDGSLMWLFVVTNVAWFAYFMSASASLAIPTTYQLNTVPGGAMLFALTALASRGLAALEARRRVPC